MELVFLRVVFIALQKEGDTPYGRREHQYITSVSSVEDKLLWAESYMWRHVSSYSPNRGEGIDWRVYELEFNVDFCGTMILLD